MNVRSLLSLRVAGRLLLGALAVLAACVPARTPPQLAATPGAAVVVSDHLYRTDAFSAAYPTGWRAITSPAGEPPFVVFAAPDGCTVIVLSLDERAAPEAAGCKADAWREAAETIEATPAVYAALRAPADRWAEAEAAFAGVVAGVRAGPDGAS